MSVIVIDKNNFQKEVLESSKPVLLDFWASWCGPCMMMFPIVDEIAAEHPEYIVGKVNVDDNPELAVAHQVTNIPTLFVFKDGAIADRAVGLRSKQQILDMLG